ncbi:MAG: PQQ-binding-like beta-propeller repeat protein [bacterium]
MITSWYSAFQRSAVIAGVFSLIVCGLLIANFIRMQTANPFNNPRLITLKNEVLKHGDKAKSAEYRELDAKYRSSYEHAQQVGNFGAKLLLVGILSFLLFNRLAATVGRKLPQVSAEPLIHRQFSIVALSSVGLIFAGVIIGLSVIPPPMFQVTASSPPTQTANPVFDPSQVNSINNLGSATATQMALPSSGTATVNIAKLPPAFPPKNGVIKPTNKTTEAGKPTIDTMPGYWADNWPLYRGPDGIGIINAKLTITEKLAVKWKSPVAMPGQSSPVVWDKNIFVTAATGKKRAVYCYNMDDGKLKWTVDIKTKEGKNDVAVSDYTGYAAPTPATDGMRVYAIFANGDLAAVDLAGKVAWIKNLGEPESQYGYAASLTYYRGRVIAQYDMAGEEDGKSVAYAFDAVTGKELWADTTRPVGNSWTSPAICKLNGVDTLVTIGKPYIIAYDPATGKMRWKIKCTSGDMASSPAIANDMLFSVVPYNALLAIKTAGKGELPESAISWQGTDGLPDITSPLAVNNKVLLVTTNGTLTCYNAKDGTKLWEHELNSDCYASPVSCGDKVIQLDDKGTLHIFNLGDKMPTIATFKVDDEGFHATPAFVGSSIILRSKDNLYCLETKK